jgi:histidyl-tRNA synthetase
MEKPTLPKGTRDFGPIQMAKRQFIFDTIKTVFQKYGFQPLETPAMENLSTLTGKYGEEGDQLLFKVLDSGDYFDKLKVDLSKSQRTLLIRDVLFDILKDISFQIFDGSTFEDTKDFFKIKTFIDDKINVSPKLRMVYLTEFEKSVLKSFFKEHLHILAYQLGKFYHDAGISKEKFQTKEKFTADFDFHFNQFRDTVLNDYLIPQILNYISSKEITTSISEKGLRYDLTVPFARYVVMNKGEITFPFKRYQIQPVWRADRPQRGRYREFYQCDADVVGTDSLLCETEIILMIKEVFKQLGIFDYSIKLNHRGILSGLAELANAKENETALFVAIDKLDKIGEEKVKEELASRGFDQASLTTVFDVLNFSGTTQQKLDLLSEKFSHSPIGQKGLQDIKQVLALLPCYGATDSNVTFDISLARGLSYYTGCIFEVKINQVGVGSVSGGGRYDNLTAMFDDKEKLSGIGFSFGVDRLYDAMTELEAGEKRSLFPERALIASKVLICLVNNESMVKGLAVLAQLREAGIASEIYPEPAKAKKPLEKPLHYALKKSIPFAVVIDAAEELLTLKNIKTGEQEKLWLDTIIERFEK